MKTYKSGENARYGIYIAPRALDFRFVGADGERLEGKDGASYLHLPALLVILASPVLGGVFVLGFPVLVVGFVAVMIAKLAGEQTRALYEQHLHLSINRWEPTTAYLNKVKKNEEKKKTEDSSKK